MKSIKILKFFFVILLFVIISNPVNCQEKKFVKVNEMHASEARR